MAVLVLAIRAFLRFSLGASLAHLITSVLSGAPPGSCSRASCSNAAASSGSIPRCSPPTTARAAPRRAGARQRERACRAAHPIRCADSATSTTLNKTVVRHPRRRVPEDRRRTVLVALPDEEPSGRRPTSDSQRLLSPSLLRGPRHRAHSTPDRARHPSASFDRGRKSYRGARTSQAPRPAPRHRAPSSKALFVAAAKRNHHLGVLARGLSLALERDRRRAPIRRRGVRHFIDQHRKDSDRLALDLERTLSRPHDLADYDRLRNPTSTTMNDTNE